MESAKAQPKHIYVLMGVVLAVMFVVGAFFEEGIAFFDPVYTTHMSDFEYYLSLIVVIFSVFGFLYLSHRFYKIKPNWWFLSIAVVLLVSNMVAVLIFPSIVQGFGENSYGNTYPFVYILTPAARARFIISFAVTCLYLYLIFAIVPKVLRNSRQLSFYFFACIVVSLVSILWSYVFEYRIYQSYFDPSLTPNINTVAMSFFNNRNTYGTMLLLGICCCAYLQTQSRHWWYYLIMAFFILNFVFVLSKTSMILALIFVVAFLIYRYVSTVKRHPLKDNIVLGIFLALGCFFCWYVLSGMVFQSQVLGKVYQNILDSMGDSSHDTLASRVKTWQRIIGFLSSQPLVIFGYGDGNFLWFLGQYEGNNISQLGYTHNGFLAMYAYGGIIRLLIYVAMLAYIFAAAIKNLARHHPTTIVSLLMFLTFLGHGLVETTSFMGADSKSLILLIIVFLPILTDRYQDRHQEVFIEQSAVYSLPKDRRAVYSLTDTEAARLFLFVFGIPFMVFFCLYNAVASFHNPWILANSCLLYLSTGLLGGCLNGIFHSKKKWMAVTLLVLAIFLLPLFEAIPFWLSGYIGFCTSIFSVTIFLGILFVFARHGREEKIRVYILRAYLPYIAICGSLVIFDLIISGLATAFTHYSALCLIAIDAACFLLVTVVSPLSKRLVYPLEEWWDRFEKWSLIANVRWESHLDWKLSQYRLSRPPHCQK